MNKQETSNYVHGLTRWIMAQPRKCLIDSYDNIFRFASFAHLSNKMSILFESNEPKAICFHHNDWIEKIEHKYEQGLQQFEYNLNSQGNAIFVGECIGKREYIGRLYKAMLQKFPHVRVTPLYTYRKGKLVRLNPKTIERFMKERGVGYRR